MLGDAGLRHARGGLHAAYIAAAGHQQTMDDLQPDRVGKRLQQRCPLLVIDLLFHAPTVSLLDYGIRLSEYSDLRSGICNKPEVFAPLALPGSCQETVAFAPEV